MAFVNGVVPVAKVVEKTSTCSFTGATGVSQRDESAPAGRMTMMYGPQYYRALRRRSLAPPLQMALGPHFGRGIVPRKQQQSGQAPMQLLSEAERLLTNPFEFFDIATREAMWTPNYGFDETETEFILTIEAAGIPKEQVSLEIKDDILTVSGGMEKEEKKEDEKGEVQTFQSRSFKRSLRIGSGVNQEKIQAAVKDGIIRIRMPKIEGEVTKTRKIPIEGEE
mmetsp:Transcript_5409/g.11404  ORF Transcript_5409/g.11404 Transcript_5409/m.11404 type:complete len:223 (-) Transcript_5409:650-1318(-)